MGKILRCGDLVAGCSTVLEAEDAATLMAKAEEHAKAAHGLAKIPPEIAAKVKAAIKDR
jgi:predicted small metal-binding protein